METQTGVRKVPSYVPTSRYLPISLHFFEIYTYAFRKSPGKYSKSKPARPSRLDIGP